MSQIAKKLAKKHPTWSTDQLFEAARKWVVASYQHLSTNTWIPEWLGVPLPPYQGHLIHLVDAIFISFKRIRMPESIGE